MIELSSELREMTVEDDSEEMARKELGCYKSVARIRLVCV
jgi:hypothetical protein